MACQLRLGSVCVSDPEIRGGMWSNDDVRIWQHCLEERATGRGFGGASRVGSVKARGCE